MYFACKSNGTVSRNTYTPGTQVTINSTNWYSQSVLIGVKGVSGSISVTANNQSFINIYGVKKDGQIGLASGSTATTRSASFSGYDYLYVSCALANNAGIGFKFTITES